MKQLIERTSSPLIRVVFSACFALMICSCASNPKPVVEQSRAQRTDLLDGSGVKKFWILQDQLMAGQPTDAASWDALFATPAYIWQASDASTQDAIRRRMQTAFDPDPSALEQSIASAEGYSRIRWEHYRRLREQRDALQSYSESLLRSDIIGRSLELVQHYLPAGTVNATTFSTPVRFLFFGPDAFATDDGIYVDLLHAFDRDDEFVLLLAHEFHHDYYDMITKVPRLNEDDELFWVLHTVRQLHMEGIADQIDKQSFPLTTQKGLSDEYRSSFNEHYRNAAATLKQFDALLCDLADAEEDRTELGKKAWSLMHFGAHPEGFYMAHVVRDAQGADALIADVGDPFAFMRRYQSVTHAFSEKAMSFLDDLEAELLQMTH